MRADCPDYPYGKQLEAGSRPAVERTTRRLSVDGSLGLPAADSAGRAVSTATGRRILTHECPAAGPALSRSTRTCSCARGTGTQVPKPRPKAVWIAWRHGAGAGTPAHRAAMRAAIAAVSRDA